MSEYSKIKDIEFPKIPVDLAKEESIRKHHVKATAYYTYGLKSLDVEVSQGSKLAAITTSTFRDIEEDLDTVDYFIRCVLELEDAIEKIQSLDESYKFYVRDLQDIKSEIETFRIKLNK